MPRRRCAAALMHPNRGRAPTPSSRAKPIHDSACTESATDFNRGTFNTRQVSAGTASLATPVIAALRGPPTSPRHPGRQTPPLTNPTPAPCQTNGPSARTTQPGCLNAESGGGGGGRGRPLRRPGWPGEFTTPGRRRRVTPADRQGVAELKPARDARQLETRAVKSTLALDTGRK